MQPAKQAGKRNWKYGNQTASDLAHPQSPASRGEWVPTDGNPVAISRSSFGHVRPRLLICYNLERRLHDTQTHLPDHADHHRPGHQRIVFDEIFRRQRKTR